MNSYTLIIAIVTAAVVTVAWSFLEHALVHDVGLPHGLLVFVVALLPALVVAMTASQSAPTPQSGRQAERTAGSQRSTAPAAAASEAVTDGPRESGHVKWFNRTKGFGFIVCANGDEIFVHHRSIRGEPRQSLEDGEAVEFVVVEHPKGLQAEDVTRAAP